MFLCEQCYLTSPALQLTSQNATDPDSPCYVTHVRGWYGFFFGSRVPVILKSADTVWEKEYDNKREKIEENVKDKGNREMEIKSKTNSLALKIKA
jgi:hypothetical protein